jgi:hypothetical protein
MKVYVQAKSKKQVNELLAAGEQIGAVEYNAFNPNGYVTHHILNELEDGAAVSIFEKYVGGQPYAKAYGTFDRNKMRLK